MAKENKSVPSSSEQALIRELAELLDATGLTEIEIEKSGLKVRVARTLTASAVVPSAGMVAPAQPATRAASEAAGLAGAGDAAAPGDAASHPGAIKSPMVGTAYLAPEPGASNFVDVGTQVTEGQTLLIIEAMKTMNHIPAPRAGTVTHILVEDNQPVEYGESLVVIE